MRNSGAYQVRLTQAQSDVPEDSVGDGYPLSNDTWMCQFTDFQGVPTVLRVMAQYLEVIDRPEGTVET